ncbi:hypothetical protein WJX81_000528 [Elliptochloris bilobata]|uniref:CMP/dCMP-type deaminase domain-containing protein n=1 Tax=Elliptochloris bilobata TaxID=381761 RepID=A0AAW1RDJ9_9CHLO
MNNKQKALHKDYTIENGVVSNHRCCAERRLLESYVAEARKHGVRPHQVVLWVRRKLGAHISVWRKRSDGTFGCATPCVLCQRELKRYDLRVHCSQDTGWFVGRLSEAGAPQAQLTTAQRRLFAIGSHQILDLRLRKKGRPVPEEATRTLG